MKSSRWVARFVGITLLLATCAAPSRAWNNAGHMAVAGFAYDMLAPREQARLVMILTHHRDIDRFRADLGDLRANGRALAMAAATWPDLIKEDHAHFRDNGYDEAGPLTRIADDGMMHKGWHFIDIPLARDATPLPASPGPGNVDAVSVVKRLIVQLRSRESDAQKAFEIAWLLHLVGDLHQPLHCVTGVDAHYPHGDHGGNDVLVTGETGGARQLHAYWDDVLGRPARGERTAGRARLAGDIGTADGIAHTLSGLMLPASRDDLNPRHWANEGYRLARRDVYSFPRLDLTTVSKGGRDVLVEKALLDDNYRSRALVDARQQVKLAGYRLGKILRTVIASSR